MKVTTCWLLTHKNVLIVIYVAECPVEAIYPDDEVPEDQQEFIISNAKLSEVWPIISVKKEAPEDADSWADVLDKSSY